MFPHLKVPELVIWLSTGIAACLVIAAVLLLVKAIQLGTG
jgi:hypothetical protein